MGFVKHYLRPDDNFLDVGANIGFYSLLASSLIRPTGVVDAFEPTPISALRLKENLKLNGIDCVTVHQKAVGNRAGTVRFQQVRDNYLNRISTGSGFEGDTEVEYVRLADAVADRHYAFGKMDIEGAELAALEGAEPMLASENPPVWLLEVNDRLGDYGYTKEEFWEWITSRGFDLAVYDPDARDIRFLNKDWLYWRERPENVLAIARTRRDFVISRVVPRSPKRDA